MRSAVLEDAGGARREHPDKLVVHRALAPMTKYDGEPTLNPNLMQMEHREVLLAVV